VPTTKPVTVAIDDSLSVSHAPDMSSGQRSIIGVKSSEMLMILFAR
jgi:hypothetical protein